MKDKTRHEQCILERDFDKIVRFASDRGIEITEENIVQNPYGGISLSIARGADVWLIEVDEYNEKFILKHMNIAGNSRKRKQRFHTNLESSYYNLIIQHIYSHNNHNERKRTRNNYKSLQIENAFDEIKRQRERKEREKESGKDSEGEYPNLRLVK